MYNEVYLKIELKSWSSVSLRSPQVWIRIYIESRSSGTAHYLQNLFKISLYMIIDLCITHRLNRDRRLYIIIVKIWLLDSFLAIFFCCFYLQQVALRHSTDRVWQRLVELPNRHRGSLCFVMILLLLRAVDVSILGVCSVLSPLGVTAEGFGWFSRRSAYFLM